MTFEMPTPRVTAVCSFSPTHNTANPGIQNTDSTKLTYETKQDLKTAKAKSAASVSKNEFEKMAKTVIRPRTLLLATVTPIIQAAISHSRWLSQ